jgi:predicted house-cleaning noncanonical NTP pyrophosphatase (MazG superfamily)
VRNKIPDRIRASKEQGRTKSMPDLQVRRFLVSKLVEEALEYREAVTKDHKLEELADAFEIVRALVESNGMEMADLISVADAKREKAGGFDEGIVLLETSIGGRKADLEGQFLAQKVGPDTVEIPFTFFGFMELDKPMTVFLDEHRVWCSLTLRKDRIVVSILNDGQQLQLDLS